jgi:SAM-dependent methyltransferase
MSRLHESYFERVYAHGDDPWGFETLWYERRKRALTMALLPAERYRRAFEPGCASGEITRLLASRADEVVAMELIPRIADRATERLHDLANVQVRRGAIPNDWPDGTFDLILLSEVVYYLDRDDLQELAERVKGSLSPGGDVVAVHYLRDTDYPMKGSEVHEALLALLDGYVVFARYAETDFNALVLRNA